jgi:hypothetical protein
VRQAVESRPDDVGLALRAAQLEAQIAAVEHRLSRKGVSDVEENLRLVLESFDDKLVPGG